MGCIVVIGLPRSGTSATAGVLQHLGVNMGDRLLPPLPANPKGFFEDLDFITLNDDLLGGKHFAPEEQFILKPHHPTWDLYTTLIARKDRENTQWGIKDPKMCFLLPHFIARVQPVVKVILVRRRFHDVVHSYQQLWGSVEKGEAIRRLGHYQYNLSKNLEDLPAHISVRRIDYEHMCRFPVDTVRQLADFVGAEYRVEASDFIDASLNRNGNLRKAGLTTSAT